MLQVPQCSSISYCISMHSLGERGEDYTLEFPIAMAITNHPMKCAHLQRKNISEN